MATLGDPIVLSGVGSYYSDTWMYNGVDWTPVMTAHSPPGRIDAGMIAIP